MPQGGQALAQCINRDFCADKAVLQIHSQTSIAVPIPDNASASESIKTLEDARRDLYMISGQECEAIKTIFGGDCAIAAVNVNSSILDRNNQPKTASLSISSTYNVTKPTK
jgi:hypothetical protein